MTGFLPPTYFLYLIRRVLLGVVGLFAVIWVLVISIDLVESTQDVGRAADGGVLVALAITLLRTPQLVLSLSPFVVLFGTLWAFGQMSKGSEISVLRSAGLSVWRLVSAPLLLAFGLGMVTITVIDPLTSYLSMSAERMRTEIRGESARAAEVLEDGVWLRHVEGTTATVIHARRVDVPNDRLNDITVWRRTLDGAFIDRWDADVGGIGGGEVVLREARRTILGEKTAEPQASFRIPINVDLEDLADTVADPNALSLWELPRVSAVIGASGISTVPFDLRYFGLWSLPMELAAMTLIACVFALGMNARSGGTAALMGAGVAIGFALFILSEFSTAMAKANIVPPVLAAWTPGLLAILFALTLLLYREDG